MENRQIIKLFRLMVSLLELHDEPVHRVRPFANAVFVLEKMNEPVAELSPEALTQQEGIGKTLAARICEIAETGSFTELDELLTATPPGLLEVLKLKGIGPKKVRTLWLELGIENIHALYEACQAGAVAKLKGFGQKTQENLEQAIAYKAASRGKFLYAELEALALELEQTLQQLPGVEQAALCGDFRRRLDVLDRLQLLAATQNAAAVQEAISKLPQLEMNLVQSGPFVWRGQEKMADIKLEIFTCAPARFVSELFRLTGTAAHLAQPAQEQQTLLQLADKNSFATEEALYEKAGLPFIWPEMREGAGEVALAREGKLPARLLELTDLKGILHNHSTWSDGTHTLEQMARYCRELGYEYLGMADHSKAAFYANGLNEGRVRQQQEEIDALNEQLAPFRIFKGIESDILNDGALDYADDVLASFDYIVASVHSNLNMDVVKATDRLLTAIHNPYTTILGHPTGRLLLRREGYPIDHKAVIDACAEKGVVIEINANPWRLDLDWRWVQYALSKGVMLSINPDAHAMSGYHDMQYGVYMGRKGGLTQEMTFNALGREAIAEYFQARKPK